MRDRFHMGAIINSDGHAEIGVYNTISHLGASRRAAFNLQREVFTLPPVSTIPKMNYPQKFPTCIKPRALCYSLALRRGKRAAIVTHIITILLPTLRNFIFMHPGLPFEVNYLSLRVARVLCVSAICYVPHTSFNRERSTNECTF